MHTSTRRFDTFAHLALPFTSDNPYTPFNAGRVPREMFYGRKAELAQILDPDGPTFVFGGRQLGKSALLRHTQRELMARERTPWPCMST